MVRGRLLAPVFLALSFFGAAPFSLAHGASAPLPKDLQGLKGELLNLNRDISQLEKELLFPSTEAAVLVSLEPGSPLKLVDIKVQLDDKDVGYHFYSPQELTALTKGGMQRIYTGNIGSGPHSLKALVTIRSESGEDVQRVATYNFTKAAQRKVIEIKPVTKANTSQGDIRFREWDVQ